uniref:Uncharacterized protein n=1 Tax=Panagrolaimus sp. JU765 TaxID=591449 RepID=A0AC34RIZ6_9BILA
MDNAVPVFEWEIHPADVTEMTMVSDIHAIEIKPHSNGCVSLNYKKGSPLRMVFETNVEADVTYDLYVGDFWRVCGMFPCNKAACELDIHYIDDYLDYLVDQPLVITYSIHVTIADT